MFVYDRLRNFASSIAILDGRLIMEAPLQSDKLYQINIPGSENMTISQEQLQALKDRQELLDMKEFVSHFYKILDNRLAQQMNDAEKEMKNENKTTYSSWINAIEETPEDDSTILVSWQDSDGKWACPIRAYYYKEDQEYYSIDTIVAIPVNAEIWHPLPKLPGE